MQNPIARVISNQAVSNFVGRVSKFYVANQSTILSVGSIGFSLASTGIALKNGAEINKVLLTARDALNNCVTKEERNQVYTLMLKELFPLVAPIVIFEGATIGCVILNKKRSDKMEARLAETAGALSIAQTAIAQYQSFQKEAEESLGEEKYQKVMNDIYKKQEFDGTRFTAVASEGAPGEVLMIDKYSNRPFWSLTGRVEMAARELSRRLSPDGGYDQVSINDFYDLIGNRDLSPNELGERFGYVSDSDWNNDISAHFADTHYIFPNGTRIPAFEVYLYPEPGCIDWGC